MENAILERQFKNFKIQYQIDVSGRLVGVPVKYPDVSALMAFFPISIERVRSLLGSRRLKPVSIFKERCLIGITIFDYISSPVGPYRELALSIPVTLDTKFSITFLPLILDSLFKSFGFYTVLLAMNSDIAREHSEKIFGYPTYSKNIEMDIKKGKDNILVNLKEENKEILYLKMKNLKNFKLEKKNFKTYFIKDNKIFSVQMNTIAFVAQSTKKKDLILSLGSHEISNLLKRMAIQPYHLKSMYYRKAIEILNLPQDIGRL